MEYRRGRITQVYIRKAAAICAIAFGGGEKIGLDKDWPTSKGCVTPYAPTAINELVKRKG